MPSSSNKILVLGSNSFSGQDLIDLLLDDIKNEVIGVSRSPEKSRVFLKYRNRSDLQRFKFYKLDLNKDIGELITLLEKEKPDYIINYAAQSDVAASWERPWDYYQTNTVALSCLLHYLQNKFWLKKYIHIGSPEAYGSCFDAEEDHSFNPSTPYAASKAAADMMVQVYSKQGLPTVIIRSTNVYGAGQQIHKIIPRAIIYAKLGKKLELRGSGEAIKSYIHIRDVTRGIIKAMEGEGVYHISPDKSISIRNLVKEIYSKLGREFNDSVKIVPRHKGRDAQYVLKSEKLRALGWKPEIDLNTGLTEVIEWVDKYLVDHLIHMPFEYKHAC